MKPAPALFLGGDSDPIWVRRIVAEPLEGAPKGPSDHLSIRRLFWTKAQSRIILLLVETRLKGAIGGQCPI